MGLEKQVVHEGEQHQGDEAHSPTIAQISQVHPASLSSSAPQPSGAAELRAAEPAEPAYKKVFRITSLKNRFDDETQGDNIGYRDVNLNLGVLAA